MLWYEIYFKLKSAINEKSLEEDLYTVPKSKESSMNEIQNPKTIDSTKSQLSPVDNQFCFLLMLIPSIERPTSTAEDPSLSTSSRNPE